MVNKTRQVKIIRSFILMFKDKKSFNEYTKTYERQVCRVKAIMVNLKSKNVLTRNEILDDNSELVVMACSISAILYTEGWSKWKKIDFIGQ